MSRIATFTALAALTCASCASVEEEPEVIPGLSTDRQCFSTRQIRGYGAAPSGRRGERIFVNSGPRDRWLLETFGPCPELNWTHAIALDTRGPSTLCTGDTATLIVPRGFDRRPDRCTVRVLGRMERPR